eukprot:UC1_evm2s1734
MWSRFGESSFILRLAALSALLLVCAAQYDEYGEDNEKNEFGVYCGVENCYDVLGVKRTATEKEIKSTYRKLARTLHPDRSKEENAKEKFQRVAAAYEALSEDRAKYDRLISDSSLFERNLRIHKLRKNRPTPKLSVPVVLFLLVLVPTVIKAVLDFIKVSQKKKESFSVGDLFPVFFAQKVSAKISGMMAEKKFMKGKTVLVLGENLSSSTAVIDKCAEYGATLIATGRVDKGAPSDFLFVENGFGLASKKGIKSAIDEVERSGTMVLKDMSVDDVISFMEFYHKNDFAPPKSKKSK